TLHSHTLLPPPPPTPTNTSPLPLHDALPISEARRSFPMAFEEIAAISMDRHHFDHPQVQVIVCRRIGGAATDSGPKQFAQHQPRSEEHTSELQSLRHLVCRLLLEKKKQEIYG